MANIEDFRIALYSKFFHETLKKSLVFAQVCNRDFEGQLSGYGKSITANGIADPTVTTYTPYSTTLTPEELTDDGGRTLSIDQNEVFAFYVEDVDKAQDMPKVVIDSIKQASYAVRNKIDSYIADMVSTSTGLIVTDLGTVATPIQINSDNVIEYLLTMGEKMTDAGVPDDGSRYIVIPSFLATKLYLASVVTMQDQDTFTNGKIGHALGFDIYQSANCYQPTAYSGVYKAIAGYSGSMTYCDQLVNVEELRHGTKMASIYRGSVIYGAKIWRPESLAVLTCQTKAEA
jgi:hypothetical protein